MRSGRDLRWLEHLIEVRARARLGDASSFYSAIERGDLVRISPGIAVPRGIWSEWNADDRFLALIHATCRRYPDAVPLSHLSAAALWGLPVLTPWPPRAETITDRESGGRSRQTLARYGHGIPSELVEIDGLFVTSLARTVVDLATILPFSAGVAAADFAIRSPRTADRTFPTPITIDDLRKELESDRVPRGRARARRVIDFADGRSGSPGESGSRCFLHAWGFPPPELQREFRDERGRIGYVDFSWPEESLIGEFDGQVKYLDERRRAGRSASEVVVDEKLREDRLRALGFGVARWTWDDLRHPERLAIQLERAGLARRRRFSPRRG